MKRSTLQHFFAPGSFQLFDLIYREETLFNVIKSVTRNGRSILLTALLALILVYLFSIVGFLFLKDDFILEVDRLPDSKAKGRAVLGVLGHWGTLPHISGRWERWFWGPREHSTQQGWGQWWQRREHRATNEGSALRGLNSEKKLQGLEKVGEYEAACSQRRLAPSWELLAVVCWGEVLLSQGWALLLADDPLGMQRNVETFMESCSSDKISCSAAPTALEGKRALWKCQLCVAGWFEENPSFSKVETKSTS